MLSERLDASAAAVQGIHVVAAAVASVERAGVLRCWDAVPVSLLSAPLVELVDQVRHLGGDPACSGGVGPFHWFVEPDLLWELTAVAVLPGEEVLEGPPGEGPSDRVRSWASSLPLADLGAAPGRGRSERLAMARLARRVCAAGFDGSDLWALATEVGDPADRDLRRELAVTLTGGGGRP